METIEISPDKAFGPRIPEKVKMVPLRRLRDKGITPQLGMRIEYDKKLATIRTIGAGRVTLDFNPPLAGKTLTYEIRINKKLRTTKERILALIHRRMPVAEISKNMYQVLFNMGFSVTLLQENITEIYYQNSIMKNARSQYLNYQQYCDSMVAFATNHPDICHLDTLGYSHQNRLLLAMKISDNAHVDEVEPVLHFEGNIHGNEKIA